MWRVTYLINLNTLSQNLVYLFCMQMKTQWHSFNSFPFLGFLFFCAKAVHLLGTGQNFSVSVFIPSVSISVSISVYFHCCTRLDSVTIVFTCRMSKLSPSTILNYQADWFRSQLLERVVSETTHSLVTISTVLWALQPTVTLFFLSFSVNHLIKLLSVLCSFTLSLSSHCHIQLHAHAQLIFQF